jgi:hypothetical protein
MPAFYASQFLLTTTEQQIPIECVPALVGNPKHRQLVFAVHICPAFSWQGMHRLASVHPVIQEYDKLTGGSASPIPRAGQSAIAASSTTKAQLQTLGL